MSGINVSHRITGDALKSKGLAGSVMRVKAMKIGTLNSNIFIKKQINIYRKISLLSQQMQKSGNSREIS
jgi:hypothetical protein